MRDPVRTIKIAGPLAVAIVAAFYIFTNIAYLASASKGEIVDSGRLVVSLLMRNIWGEKVERWVDFGVACSSLGSVLAMVGVTLLSLIVRVTYFVGICTGAYQSRTRERGSFALE